MRHITPYNQLNEKLGVAKFVEEFAEVLRPYISKSGIKIKTGTSIWDEGDITFIFDLDKGRVGYTFKRLPSPTWIDNYKDTETIRKMRKITEAAGVKFNLGTFFLILWSTSHNGVVGQQAGSDTISLAMDRDPDEIDSTMMHEINHLYQDHKGWTGKGYFTGSSVSLDSLENKDMKSDIVHFNRLIYLSMKNEVDARIPQAYDDLVAAEKRGLPLSNSETFRRQIKVLSGYKDAMELINQLAVKNVEFKGDNYILAFWKVWKALYGHKHVVGYRADSGDIKEIDIDDDMELLKKIRDLKATKEESRKKAEEEEYARTHTPEMLARENAKNMADAKRFVADWSKVFTRRGEELKWKIARLYDKFVPSSEDDIKIGSWMEFKYKGKPFTGKYKGKEGDYYVFSGNWDSADSLSGETAKLSEMYIKKIIKKMQESQPKR